MKAKKKDKEGLSDTELVEKYEKGAIKLHTHVKKLLRKPSKSSILKKKKKA